VIDISVTCKNEATRGDFFVVEPVI